MKNENGITLISLVVTIVIMLIIAGVATNSGMESIEESKKMAFISEMEMIQAKVNSIYEERKNNEEKTEYYNTIGQELSAVNEEVIEKLLDESNKTGFKYFNKSDLGKLDLYNINQKVLINYDTREVISIDGVKIDGTIYYKLIDIPNYSGYNVEYKDKNTNAPTFTVEQTKLGNYEYRFTLKNIVYNSNVKGGTVSYKLHSDANWILNGENTSFTVYKKGFYDIKYVDSAGNSTIENVYINDEIYKEEFDTFNYSVSGMKVNSCINGILDVTSTNNSPIILIDNIPSVNTKEYRYVEVKYKTATSENMNMKLFMKEKSLASDEELIVESSIINDDGEWNTIILDLWSNDTIKEMDKITVYGLNWADKANVTMQIDYIRIY